MVVKRLAESVLMQAVSDLFDPLHRQESLEFFTGEGFTIATELAGMGHEDKLRLLEFITRIKGSAVTGRRTKLMSPKTILRALRHRKEHAAHAA